MADAAAGTGQDQGLEARLAQNRCSHPSMRHQHRYGRLGQHIARGPAQDHLAEPAMAIGTHDQQIGIGLLGMLQQRMADGLADAARSSRPSP